MDITHQPVLVCMCLLITSMTLAGSYVYANIQMKQIPRHIYEIQSLLKYKAANVGITKPCRCAARESVLLVYTDICTQ